ncbi:hypothetical protein FRC16_004899, partial [Serendipita sp. 398]
LLQLQASSIGIKYGLNFSPPPSESTKTEIQAGSSDSRLVKARKDNDGTRATRNATENGQ